MLRDIRLPHAMVLQNRQDVPIRPIPAAVIAALYEGEGEHFMVEAVDMADIESTYFYDTPLMPEINAVMFEAVTSTRARLSGTMRAFIRALNQSLNGTGITAGNDTSGAADDGSQAMGGANIGRVRKVQGLAIMPAIIPLSDGQTVTLVFHSPTGNAATIAANDTLVAFQFLLNKKDVTHVVSPSNGRDISLKVVTTALSNLIERNTAKFQHAQAKQKAVKAEIASMQSEGEKLEEQQASLVEQGDALQAAIKADAASLSDLSHKADQQEALNEELQAQVNAAQKKKDDAAAAQVQERQARAGALKAITAKTGYKDTYVANWAYNQNIPTADLVDLASRLDNVDVYDLKDLIMYKGQVSDLSDIPALKARMGEPAGDDPGPRTLYWYGLRARPAGVGALPQDPQPAVTATPEEAADLQIVKQKGLDPSTYRNGAVAYTAPLSADDVSQYELVDFQSAVTAGMVPDLISALKPLIENYAGDAGSFITDFLKDGAPRADEQPQGMKDAGGFMALAKRFGLSVISQFNDLFKQVKADQAPKKDSVELGDGDTVPLETIQTGAMMPTIAKGATSGDNPIWYTQSTLNDIVAAAKFKVNGQSATSNPAFAESRYQMVKAALAAGFGLQRFKISGLQYIYVLRRDDDILTTQGAAKFMPADSALPVAPETPASPARRTLVARAFEQAKGPDAERDGRLLMWIEGPEDFIRWADKELRATYDSAHTEEEGKNEGEISVAFGVDRSDKSAFMAEWKALKERWIKGEDATPEEGNPATVAAATGENGYVSVMPAPAEAQAITEQVQALGIVGGIAPEKLHVTLMYSKDHPVNAQPEPDRVYQARLTGQYQILGDALVALLDSPDLKARFDELSAAGGVHSYSDYLPHLSLKYGATQDDLDLIEGKGLETTSVSLSGETFEPIKDTPAKPAPAVEGEFSPFMKAVQQIASLTGRNEDAVAHWAEVQNVHNDDLTAFAAALAANPSPENMSAINNAFDFGSALPDLKEATPVDDTTKPDPEQPEADAAAQQAITYLKQVAEMQSSDLVEIRNARGSVRQAIAALTAAGIYDENEELVNAAAQHLADLLASVAQKGAA